MLYIAFVCNILSIFLFTYNNNLLSKKEKKVLIVAFQITLRLFHFKHNTTSMSGVHLGILVYNS